jgi:hypothetical protein
MKKFKISWPDLFYALAFLLYLAGSSMAHIYNGIELSLWLMAFAMGINASVTVLPWFGIHWLRLARKGSQTGRWLALLMQVSSWGTYAFAMFQRLNRSLPRFQLWTAVTTLLWAVWLLIFVYSRHACESNKSATLNVEPTQPQHPSIEETLEDS